MSKVLVTGGAGYIGSHTVKDLGLAGHDVVTLDNLSKGFREAVLNGDLIVGDTGDADTVEAILRDRAIDTVMHFAACTVVPESVADPLKYYGNNTCNTRSLIECCVRAGVKYFIFSSTAAVYGVQGDGLCDETTPTEPINPYGQSKLMSELILRDTCRVTDMRAAVLRYFNVAGSDPDCEIGQSTVGATLLIKVAVEAALGKRDLVAVFGTDYSTPDGTGIRDYIHVTDLAHAHVDALDYLERGGASVTLNCGYGHGSSVREVLDTVERVAGTRLNIEEQGRRAGDPAALVARADRIRKTFGWTPRYDDLETIVATSLAWERKLSERDG